MLETAKLQTQGRLEALVKYGKGVRDGHVGDLPRSLVNQEIIEEACMLGEGVSHGEKSFRSIVSIKGMGSTK